MTKRETHHAYYFFLTTVLLIGLAITWRLGPDKNLQMISLLVLSVSYAAIGILHHLHAHDLVGKIVIEYVLVALLGISASFFIFKGGFGF
jgi:hypothetical protein